MSLDAEVTRLTHHGRVEILADGAIYVHGFDGENASCRDIAALAMTWAIGVLQRDLLRCLEEPGGSRCCIGEDEPTDEVLCRVDAAILEGIRDGPDDPFAPARRAWHAARQP